MARQKITPPSEGDTDIVDVTPTTSTPGTQLAAPQNTSLGTPNEYDPDQYDDLSRDATVPVVGLIGNTGPLTKKFKNKTGNFAFGDVLLLGESVRVIPVAAVKFYAEKFRDGEEIKYGSPLAATRKIFATAGEAARAGYVVDFANKARNSVEEAARIGYLVIAPEGDKSGEFVLKAGGKLPVAVAKSTYQRGSYRSTFRPIFNFALKLAQAKGVKIAGLDVTQLFAAAQPWTNEWTLTGRNEDRGEKNWWETDAAKGPELDPAVVAWITENYSTFRI